MARPTKLTADVQKAIVDAIAAGAFARDAAQAAGVSESTYYAWLERGRVELERQDLAEGATGTPTEVGYLKFLEAMTRASARANVAAVALIRKAAQDGEWRAAAFLLERRFPAEWGKTAHLQHSGPDDGPVKTEGRVAIDIADPVVAKAIDTMLGRFEEREREDHPAD